MDASIDGRISRRDFIKYMGILGAGVGAGLNPFKAYGADKAEASVTKWKYAIEGAPIPTEEGLIQEGYQCLNCANPTTENRFSTRPDINVTLKAYRKDKHGLVLFILPNNEIYGFQEVNGITKESIWAYDEKNTDFITKAKRKGVGPRVDIDLPKYGFK